MGVNVSSLQRPLRRVPYFLAALLVATLEFAIKLLLAGDSADPAKWSTYVRVVWPGLDLLPMDKLALPWLVTGLAGSIATVFLSLRRVRDARGPEFMAALAMIPLLRIPLLLVLTLLPSRPANDDTGARDAHPGRTSRWRIAPVAVAAGALLSVFSVAVGALVFGTYAHAMYLLTPLYFGAMTGFLINRRGDVGMAATAKAVWLATVLAAILLLALALEGVICILLIIPLAYVVALVGSALGCAVAASMRHRTVNALGIVLVLPIVFAVEYLAASSAHFAVSTEVLIAAPPRVVWSEVVGIKGIREQPGLPFRLGVSHPLSVDLTGEGVGAMRLSMFSTGLAVQTVTVWQPSREFAFEVLAEPPSMRELSPYDEVHAPHVRGYFRTQSARYLLEALPDGGTRLVETSQHTLDMQPHEYWLPIARWLVGETHGRVLRQIRDDAQRAAGRAPTDQLALAPAAGAASR